MTPLTQACPISDLPGNVADALLLLADDEFVIGHRHSEWLGLSPFLEEDLTMASIAQDELGHARALYRLLWSTWGGREQGVVRRGAGDWRSCSLVERQSPSWEFALVRHTLYDMAEPYRWKQLRADHATVVPGLHALVESVLAEETFHQRHATDLVVRLGRANSEARGRLQKALDNLWPDALAMSAGATGNHRWAEPFFSSMGSLCDRAQLILPAAREVEPLRHVDRTTRHPDFDSVSESLLAVIAFDPEATW